jgi:hypothetical protein
MRTDFQHKTVNLLAAQLLAVGILFIVGCLVYSVVHTPPAITYGSLPESGERAIFLCLIILVLPITIGSIRSVRQFPFDPSQEVLGVLLISMALIGVGLIATLIAKLYKSGTADYLGDPRFLPIAITGVLLALCFFMLRGNPDSKPIRIPFIRLVIAGMTLFTIIAYRIFPASAVDYSFQFTTHLDAVLYTASQTAVDKMVLADLPGQYGLYAEFLAPLSHIFGFSVLIFTIEMAVLQAIGVLSILWVLLQVVRTDAVRLLGSLALLGTVGYTWFAPHDPYFQYYPIRFFFPAISLALFCQQIKKPTRLKNILLGMSAGLAIPFNLDSGIPVFGAGFATLLFQALYAKEKRGARIKDIGIFVAATICSIAGFIGIMELFGRPNWAELVRYQTTFYIGGISMLPMPDYADYWVYVVSIYLFGIVAALWERMRSSSTKFIFYLSILGIGLFSYYQGRSHIIVLTLAAWPAVIISMILLDRVRRAIEKRLLSRAWAGIQLPPTFLGIFLACLFVCAVPSLVSNLCLRAETMLHEPSSELTRSLAFIRSNLRNKGSVVIIAPHQAVYYSETHTASAVKGPSIAENVLHSEQDAFVDRIILGDVEEVFYRPDPNYIPAPFDRVLRGPFNLIATSKDGMMYLRRKN